MMFKIIFSQFQIFLKMKYYEILTHKSYPYKLYTKGINEPADSVIR